MCLVHQELNKFVTSDSLFFTWEAVNRFSYVVQYTETCVLNSNVPPRYGKIIFSLVGVLGGGAFAFGTN